MSLNWWTWQGYLLLGQAKYKAVYSRQTQQWVAKPIHEGTTQAFRDDLVEHVLRRREDRSVVLSKPMPSPRPRRMRLLCNTSPVPRPQKRVIWLLKPGLATWPYSSGLKQFHYLHAASVFRKAYIPLYIVFPKVFVRIFAFVYLFL